MLRLRARLTCAIVGAILLLLATTVQAPAALAHAELRQSSPAADETVGGEFHQITLQFTGLDANNVQRAEIFDPAGNSIGSPATNEGQRIVISIEPLRVAGQYTVSYSVNGIDGDFTEESFSFRYDPDADEPSGITIGLAEPRGFDFISLGLLLIGAALAAFLVHRVMEASREHRAAKGVATPPTD